MEFYNDSLNVDEYEKMCSEYDGSELYELLDTFLRKGATLLELGCGPGNDVENLMERYKVTGSDLSDEFLNRCRAKFPELPFLKLDAISIDVDSKFNCIFSNKVLQHLTIEELDKSLKRQQNVLEKNGIFAHTFWLGDKELTLEGMLFVYHDKLKLNKMISKYFTVQSEYLYKEFEDGDSIFIIAKNDKF
ncbi:MAG: class I SAM-dependent methyltransferase [Melioribacteraceae bacterium]|nr:class I SAM-dependent methyltransferase [Melioribacteraceae bacterium]MCF8265398.1 class I SAM-dependent methyltransferase [Melioribacteraceae bacterium]MCF8414313.1 class I SAM-dependent methyltransferase [Melioribacteraceae bacterium]MCF8432431.1 class I SAM-dependent methyltransferase [Melioribacteraceae bacterium]